MSNTPSGRGAALQPACRQRLRGSVRRETRGNPEKIPLGGAKGSRTLESMPRAMVTLDQW